MATVVVVQSLEGFGWAEDPSEPACGQRGVFTGSSSASSASAKG